MEAKFKNVISEVKKLEKDKRYLGAFVFGSVANGDTTPESDMDVKVIIDTDSCENINHPFIDGIKLDITFFSFGQLERLLEHQGKKQERPAMIAQSIILFDKTGKLKKLKQKFEKIRPKKYTKKDYQLVRFLLFFLNQKVEQSLRRSPIEGVFSMMANINDVWKIHYQLHGHWLISSKKVFADLAHWDKRFLSLLKMFVAENDPQKKYRHWHTLLEYVAKPLGGMQKVEDNNCDCKNCRIDLGNLASANFF